MDRPTLLALLNEIRDGTTAPDAALERIASPGFVGLEDARVDTHRALRHGIPEVVFGSGKTGAQVVEIARALRRGGQSVLATRIEPATAAECLEELPGADYDPGARLLWLGPAEPEILGKGTIAVVCAGTADLPVAREAAGVAHRFGNKVDLLVDVGVAGIHRLLAESQLLRSARVVIAVAGMEGALPSVVGGLVDRAVIAVPTSVGYGASFQGLAALLGMLNSCASNVTVVNIDNGFGAAYVATLINRL